MICLMILEFVQKIIFLCTNGGSTITSFSTQQYNVKSKWNYSSPFKRGLQLWIRSSGAVLMWLVESKFTKVIGTRSNKTLCRLVDGGLSTFHCYWRISRLWQSMTWVCLHNDSSFTLILLEQERCCWIASLVVLLFGVVHFIHCVPRWSWSVSFSCFDLILTQFPVKFS